jgi:GT2 family glycosyltransferase
MMPRLDVVIVNWNAGALLAACVDSVLAARRERFELGDIIVVDNASTDDSLARLAARPREAVRVVHSGGNCGFGRACNLGTRAGRGELVLFLNPDTRVFPETLDGAVQLFAAAPESLAVCGIRLIDDAGVTARGCARLPTWRTFAIAALGLDRVFPGSGYMMTNWDHRSSRFVDHVIGAFYLVRRRVFEALGGFDERFFVYLEDLDFSQRVSARGLQTWYSADVSAYHMGGGTSRAVLARRLFYSLRSRLQYASKHLSAGGTLVVFVTTLLVEPIVRMVRAILTARPSDAWNVCRAYAMLYRSVLGGELRAPRAAS